MREVTLALRLQARKAPRPELRHHWLTSSEKSGALTPNRDPRERYVLDPMVIRVECVRARAHRRAMLAPAP
jgi:hypothetical protein